MDTANQVLFLGENGEKTPRFVGTPEQWPIFDEKSFELFHEANSESANCYCRISWYSRTADIVLDKVLLDLDGDKPEGMTDTEMVLKLRKDPDFREQVLGDVIEDVRTLAEFGFEESIPMIGVYSGKGVHVHALFEPKSNPTRELKSNTRWLKDECDLQTFDQEIFGDVKRLCRVANCRRYDTRLGSPTEMYTVPLSKNEMRNITAGELVEWAEEPRDIEAPGESRPPFLIQHEYDKGSTHSDPDQSVEEVEKRDLGPVKERAMTDKLEMWLESVLQLPCMYERIQTRNPAHYVRLNCAVMMFNAGLGIEDIVHIYSRLGWRDFDADVTRTQLKSIVRNGYRSMSCSTIQTHGLCVYERGERSESCHAYGYKGGDKHY